MPTPRIIAIQWDAFFESLAQLQPFVYERGEAGAVGCGDPEQLEQVFINLAKNAAEAGSVLDQIVVQQSRREGGTDIVISDRGRGMSEEALSNALLPFYSTKRSGSGLGLSLSREIIDAHDGRISIRNRTGGGVSVRLWLPDHPDAVKRSPLI